MRPKLLKTPGLKIVLENARAGVGGYQCKNPQQQRVLWVFVQAFEKGLFIVELLEVFQAIDVHRLG